MGFVDNSKTPGPVSTGGVESPALEIEQMIRTETTSESAEGGEMLDGELLDIFASSI
jgi:hypothetical protein